MKLLKELAVALQQALNQITWELRGMTPRQKVEWYRQLASTLEHGAELAWRLADVEERDAGQSAGD